ncbi:MAG TPA: mycothiol system anti-sigma-R factor [Kineosporiaceae bacterium]
MSCGDPHDTDCGEVLRRLHEYLDGELDLDGIAKISQHLDECGPCLSEYDLDLFVKALVRRTCGCERAPAELRARIMTKISQLTLG